MATARITSGGRAADQPVDEQTDQLTRTWSPGPGIIGWLSQTNHKSVGLRFITTAFIFFLIAGVGALLMRLQLTQSNLNILSHEAYNQIFTMHGTTMMFLFGVPIMEGFGIYLVPMMIGTRDMAFPRLNAFGYWVYLLAGATLYLGLVTAEAPDGGWFNYVPLTNREFSPGLGIDYWVTAITFLEIAALVAAVELIVTILKQRAPGMSLNRMPLFVWAILIVSFMIVFAMPPLMLASVFLALDRTVGAHFFNISGGGDAVLWQHIFWFFGHPEVYIIFLPALGLAFMIVTAFSRRPHATYTLVVLSLIAVGFISFGVWVHHMFAVGLPQLGMSLFSAASMVIGIASGVQIFALIATMWGRRPILATPLLFVVGFIIIFVLGGITGIMVGSIPFDQQVHDTYFVVAHFHYVLIGGAVFPLFGALYMWFPKVSGRLLNEALGKWSFWLMFIGFNVAFFTMHLTGFRGMPRRVYTYAEGLGWDSLNLISTIGAFVMAAGVGLTLLAVVISLLRPRNAPDNPWDAGTLEWATASPPEQFNFRHIPIIHSRYPLWDWRREGEPADNGDGTETRREQHRAPAGVELAHETEWREAVVTDLSDADLQTRIILAGPSIWPFFAALSVGVVFLGILIDVIFAPIGALLAFISFVGWLWPSKAEQELKEEHGAV